MPQVRERMTSSVVTIEPTATVVDAARRMIEQEKGPLPVVEGDRLVGIISEADLRADEGPLA
jgi:acetoin utilization protein AcuB